MRNHGTFFPLPARPRSSRDLGRLHPRHRQPSPDNLQHFQCQNGLTSHQCWVEFDIDIDINTNYYDPIFYTNRTVKYWLALEEIDCAPHGNHGRLGRRRRGPRDQQHRDQRLGHPLARRAAAQQQRERRDTRGHAMPHRAQDEHDVQVPRQAVRHRLVPQPLQLSGLGAVFITGGDHSTADDHWVTFANFSVTFNGFDTKLINGTNTGNCTAGSATKPDPNCVGE
ncbi:hypothetical protein BBP40_003156, partial [Aspergillus hancockii]